MNIVRHEQGLSNTKSRFPAESTCLAIYSRCMLPMFEQTSWPTVAAHAKEAARSGPRVNIGARLRGHVALASVGRRPRRNARGFRLLKEAGLPVAAKCFAGGQNGWSGSSSLAGACRPDGDHPSRLQPSPQQRQGAAPSQLRRPG
jgi:hypothetical protein